MDILDDMGESKLSAKVFLKKVNYSFKTLFVHGVVSNNFWMCKIELVFAFTVLYRVCFRTHSFEISWAR